MCLLKELSFLCGELRGDDALCCMQLHLAAQKQGSVCFYCQVSAVLPRSAWDLTTLFPSSHC